MVSGLAIGAAGLLLFAVGDIELPADIATTGFSGIASALATPVVAASALLGAVGLGVSRIAHKFSLEAKLDSQELESMRKAKHLQLAFGDKGHGADIARYEMMNRGRSDGKSWADIELERSASQSVDDLSRYMR